MSKRKPSRWRPEYWVVDEEITLAQFIEKFGEPEWLIKRRQIYACIPCSNDGYLLAYDFHLYGMVDPNAVKQRRWNRNQFKLKCARCGHERPQYNTKKFDDHGGPLGEEWIAVTSRTETKLVMTLKHWKPSEYKISRMRQPFNGYAFSSYWGGPHNEPVPMLPRKGKSL